ncbi:hypothetical protein [Curtobacterium sp. ISL-83]|nr:hypothetical protein [Curtobacterium sp. ISL-83]MBT2502213.1 hypothetical protein [Curtobacterium sp. ISL-83]
MTATAFHFFPSLPLQVGTVRYPRVQALSGTRHGSSSPVSRGAEVLS